MVMAVQGASEIVPETANLRIAGLLVDPERFHYAPNGPPGLGYRGLNYGSHPMLEACLPGTPALSITGRGGVT